MNQKDYFADIVFTRVTEGNKSNALIDLSKTAIPMGGSDVTLNTIFKVTVGNNAITLPTVTLKKLKEVTQEAPEIKVLPLLPSVTHQNWTYEQEERLAILEYGGG